MKPSSSHFATALSSFLVIGLAGVAHAQEPPPDEPDEDEAGMPMPPDEVAPEAETRLADPVPEPPPEEPEAEPAAGTTGYDKGFFIKQETDKGSFEMKINARVQTLATFDSVDGGSERTNTSQFQIRRARLTLDGHSFTEKLAYKFQTDFGTGFLTLKDFYIDGEVAPGTWIRVGQWKKPFSRQQINSSGRLELVDRAITDKEFLLGRDIGVGIHNGYEKSPDTEWAVGVFNGSGDKPGFSGTVPDPTTGVVVKGGFSNVPKKFMPVLVGRFGLNRGGIKGYNEADLEGGGMRWAAAASVWIEANFDDDGFTRRQGEVDFVVKNDGLSVSGAVIVGRVNGPTDAIDQNTLGAHLQVGKMVGEKTKRLQPVVRYAMIMDLENPDNPDSGTLDQEITVGGGWYPYAHDCKLQLDLGTLIGDGGGVADHLVGRLQFSTGF